MSQEIVWKNLELGSPDLHVLPRDVTINAQIEKMNADYGLLSDQITELYKNGNIGRFQLMDPEYQPIVPELGVTRKVYLSHPDFPEEIFVATGIGYIQRDENGHYVLNQPDLSKVLRDARGLPETIMSTIRIGEEGNREVELNNEPLGAYHLKSAKEKFVNTAQAQKKKMFGKDVEICTNVAYGKYNENTGFYMYSIPKGYKSPNDIVLNFENEPREYFDLLYKTMEALRKLHGQGFVSRQHHPGNVFYRPEDQRLLVTDLETMMSISGHRLNRNKNEFISPKGHAIWNDAEKTLQTFVNVMPPIPEENTQDISNFYFEAFAQCMKGYFGEDNMKNNSIDLRRTYNHFLKSNGDIHSRGRNKAFTDIFKQMNQIYFQEGRK